MLQLRSAAPRRTRTRPCNNSHNKHGIRPTHGEAPILLLPKQTSGTRSQVPLLVRLGILLQHNPQRTSTKAGKRGVGVMIFSIRCRELAYFLSRCTLLYYRLHHVFDGSPCEQIILAERKFAASSSVCKYRPDCLTEKSRGRVDPSAPCVSALLVGSVLLCHM